MIRVSGVKVSTGRKYLTTHYGPSQILHPHHTPPRVTSTSLPRVTPSSLPHVTPRVTPCVTSRVTPSSLHRVTPRHSCITPTSRIASLPRHSTASSLTASLPLRHSSRHSRAISYLFIYLVTRNRHTTMQNITYFLTYIITYLII